MSRIDEARAWLTFIAASISASAPFAILWFTRRQSRQEYRLRWSATLAEEFETNEGVRKVELRYEMPTDIKISLVKIEVVAPKDASITGMMRGYTDDGGMFERPQSLYTKSIELSHEMKPFGIMDFSGVRQFDYSTYTFYVSFPRMIEARASFSMRLTVERISHNRSRDSFKVTTNEIALIASSPAKAT